MVFWSLIDGIPADNRKQLKAKPQKKEKRKGKNLKN